MLLYHGTSERHLDIITKNDIKPRGKKRGNWNNTVTSNPKCIYLTTGYAIYFAGNAISKDNKVERLMVLEIETDRLHQQLLVPDEDFLEQATRKSGPAPLEHNMKQRTLWFRKRLLGFSHHWRDSIEHMGTCGYHGPIPVSAITRIALLTQEAYSRLVWHGMDPTISILNYKIMGAKYRNYCHWLFNDPLEPDPITEAFENMKTLDQEFKDSIERHKISNLSHEGVEVLTR